MSDCQKVVEFLSAYLEGDLDPETIEGLDGHLQDCPPCVYFVDTFRRMIAATGRIPTIETIPSELRERLHSFLSENINRRP